MSWAASARHRKQRADGAQKAEAAAELKPGGTRDKGRADKTSRNDTAAEKVEGAGRSPENIQSLLVCGHQLGRREISSP